MPDSPCKAGITGMIRVNMCRCVFIAALAVMFVSSSRADVLFLKSGGRVEGAIIEKNEQGYKVRTTVGKVTIPLDAVTSIEEKPTILDEYERRRGAVEDTAAAHVALALWCEAHELSSGHRTHMREALKLDSDCAPARAALGYVLVEGKWITKRKLEKDSAKSNLADKAESPTPEADAATEEARKIIAAIRSQWILQIRAIQSHKLDSGIARLIEDGRRKILEIGDPLAIEPMSRLLSTGSPASRRVLVEALSLFPQDEATANLAMLAIVDPDREIRRRVLLELKRRADPRVIPQFRRALLSDNDELIKRASTGLGIMKATAATPDLIDLLTARRRRLVELDTRIYFRDFQMPFFKLTSFTCGPMVTMYYTPTMGVSPEGAGFYRVPVNRDYAVRNVTVYRTEVLEALKAITGVNHGFDAKAWRRWFEEQ